MRHFRFIAGVCLCLSLSPARDAMGQGGSAEANLQQAVTQLERGNQTEALRLFDAILAANPDDPQALFYSGRLLTYRGDYALAEPRIERLVKALPAAFQGWELLVQITQNLGKLARRDAAIGQIHAARRSAIDPEVRRRLFYVRDRITVNGRVFMVQDMFEAAGSSFVRVVVIPEADAAKPIHVIALGSDDATNQQWRENAVLPPGQVVYHLSTHDLGADGFHTVTPYEFYIGEPDYDRVRLKVMEILNGKASPLMGDANPYWVSIAR